MDRAPPARRGPCDTGTHLIQGTNLQVFIDTFMAMGSLALTSPWSRCGLTPQACGSLLNSPSRYRRDTRTTHTALWSRPTRAINTEAPGGARTASKPVSWTGGLGRQLHGSYTPDSQSILSAAPTHHSLRSHTV